MRERKTSEMKVESNGKRLLWALPFIVFIILYALGQGVPSRATKGPPGFLVIDLRNNGLELKKVFNGDGVYFNWANDGFSTASDWVEKNTDDAFVLYLPNGRTSDISGINMLGGFDHFYGLDL